MGRNGMLALCLIGLVAGVAWAVHSRQPVVVTLGITVGMVLLSLLMWRVTADRKGE